MRLPVDIWQAWAAYSAACACVSLTVTRAKVTARFRSAVQARSAWFGELVSCPYCFSHWASLALVLGCRFRLLGLPEPADALLTAAALTASSSLVASTVLRNFRASHTE